LADGSKSVKLTARGIAEMEGESEVGVVVLEPNSSEVLIGMAFLRLFKRALLLSQDKVYLVDESRTPETSEPPVEPAETDGVITPSSSETPLP
jgi:hypothetical protein